MLSRAKSFACSLWAQQGSNLRPLGEQRTGYQGYSNPIDLAKQGDAGYHGVPEATPKTDDKVTVDLARRYPRRRPLRQRLTDTIGVIAVFPLALVAVYAVYREDRKAVRR